MNLNELPKTEMSLARPLKLEFLDLLRFISFDQIPRLIFEFKNNRFYFFRPNIPFILYSEVPTQISERLKEGNLLKWSLNSSMPTVDSELALDGFMLSGSLSMADRCQMEFNILIQGVIDASPFLDFFRRKTSLTWVHSAFYKQYLTDILLFSAKTSPQGGWGQSIKLCLCKSSQGEFLFCPDLVQFGGFKEGEAQFHMLVLQASERFPGIHRLFVFKEMHRTESPVEVFTPDIISESTPVQIFEIK